MAGSGLRQIARSVGCSPSTVMRMAARLGRHCLLFLAERRGRASEPVVFDGFESFAFSQYYPLHLNLAVGAESHFVYGFTESELRRKGRMTPAQKERRTAEERRYGRPDPKAIETGVRELLEAVLPDQGNVTLRSDEHPAYPRAIRPLAGEREVAHDVTSSKEARTASNPLFPVNRQDLMLRHCGANHRRETIAFSKTRAGVIERAAIQLVWMSFVKSFSEKRQDATPAQRAGVHPEPLTVRQCLRRRLFATRATDLPAVWERYYRRQVRTRRYPDAPEHGLRYAF